MEAENNKRNRPEFLSMEDLAERVKQDLVKESALCQVADGHISLADYPGDTPNYDIALDRCNTPEKVLGWVYHLSEKTWITSDHIRAFIKMACREHGFDYTGLS